MPDFFDILSLRFSSVLPQTVAGLAVAGAFWLLARYLGGFIMRYQSKVAKDHKDLVGLLADVSGWALFIIGAIAGLGTAGVNVTALVAGLGLVGFAAGFAMRDILSNAIAGVMILLLRPYGQGDKVRIDKFQGTVVRVDLRYTTLEAPGAKILVPNAKAHSEIVVLLSGDVAEADTAPAPAPAPARAPALSIKTASKPVAGA